MNWPKHQDAFLSAHFKRRELECRCCHSLVLDPALIICLEWLRSIVGKSITINSGYRCISHNIAIGGEPGSQHMQGRAADIRVDGITPVRLKELAEQIPYFAEGGIGLYETFVHVDVRGLRARW